MRFRVLLMLFWLVLCAGTLPAQTATPERVRPTLAGSHPHQRETFSVAASQPLFAESQQSSLSRFGFVTGAEKGRPSWLFPVIGAVAGGAYFGATYDCNDCWVGEAPWIAVGAGIGALLGGVVELLAGG